MANVTQEKEYFAFISYQRKDEEWAKWLANGLEHYHLPTTLNGKELPKNLRPIFRDVDELSAGNLPEQIYHALSISKNLIVVCSPRSAKSEWVNKEIEDFRKIKGGKADNIYPFIIEGAPFSKDADEECFPEELRNLPENEERLGGNINETGGKNVAVVKTIAGMLGVSHDSLWNRFEREQRKKRKLRIAAAIVAFICISCISFWMYWQNQQTQKANWKMMENQSKAIAEKIRALIEEGDLYTAQLLALEILPDEKSRVSRPYTPEAESALHDALAPFEKDGYKQISVLRGSHGWGRSYYDAITVSELEDAVYFISNGSVYKHNLQNGEEFQFDNKDVKNRFGQFGLLDDSPMLLNKEETKLCVLDCSNSTIYYIWDTRNGELLQKGEAEIDLYEDYDLFTNLGIPFTYKETGYQRMEIGDLPLEIRQKIDDNYCDIYNSRNGKYYIVGEKVFSKETRNNYLSEMKKITVNPIRLEFSRDSRQLAIGEGNGDISIIDVNTLDTASNLKGTSLPCQSLVFSDDDKMIFELASDSINSELLLYNTNGTLLTCIRGLPTIQTAGVNWDNNLIITMDSVHNNNWDVYNWSLWTLSNNSIIKKKEFDMSMELICPIWESSKSLLFLSKEGMMINRWNYETGEITTASATPMYTTGNGQDFIAEIHIDNNNNIIAAAGQGSNQLLNKNSLDILHSFNNINGSANLDSLIWERESSHIQEYLATSRVTKDGQKLLTISYGGVLRLYDIRTGIFLQGIALPCPKDVDPYLSNFAISYDGQIIAYSFYDNNCVYLIKLPTLQNLIDETKKTLKGRKLNNVERRQYYLD